jgi:hypothetical protein
MVAVGLQWVDRVGKIWRGGEKRHHYVWLLVMYSMKLRSNIISREP